MIEVIGDIRKVFTRPNYDAICCTTNKVLKRNGELVMGAGIAKVFSQTFPGLAASWGRALRERPSGTLIYTKHYKPGWPHPVHLVAFPTKDDWRDDSKIELIEQSARLLESAVNTLGWDRILVPRPGCQNGGLEWDDVKPVLEPIFDNRFYIISR